MDKEAELEAKYQRLATEYSKVRSQATVLKKAVLDEQTKNVELHDVVKKHEQTMRKRDQEMESLNFRNEQLTKRIMVLQQDLQINSTTANKKNKNKVVEMSPQTDLGVINEELQKKILENVQLFNSVAEKETELLEFKEKNKFLEDIISNLQKELQHKDTSLRQEKENHIKENKTLEKTVAELTATRNDRVSSPDLDENLKHWRNEAERWKSECDMLRSRPQSNEKLTNYYELKLSEILKDNVLLKSENKTLWAENLALKARLENVTLEHSQLKSSLESSSEELMTTNDNYKSQLDAMTEHLAAQNEKITKQCDEIQVLKHRLSLKK